MRSYSDDFNAVLKQWRNAAKLEGAAARGARELTERLVHAFRKRVAYYLDPICGGPALLVNKPANNCILMSWLIGHRIDRDSPGYVAVTLNYSGFEIDFPLHPTGNAMLSVHPAGTILLQECDFCVTSDSVSCPEIVIPWNKRDADLYITKLDAAQYETASALLVAGQLNEPPFSEFMNWVDDISKIKKDVIEATVEELEEDK